MGIFDGKAWKGPIGPLSLRSYRGLQLGQSKPAKVAHHENTKNCSATFGKSGQFASSIKMKFSYLMKGCQHGEFYNRLNSRLALILDSTRSRKNGEYDFTKDSFELLLGFDLNSESPVTNTLRVIPKWFYENNELKITLPRFKIPEQLKFPKGVPNCQITFYTLLYNLEDATAVKTPEEHNVQLHTDDLVSEEKEFIFNVPDGTLAITGMFLEFYNFSRGFKYMFNTKAWYPASICATVLAPGDFEDVPGRKFLKMNVEIK